MSRAAPLADAEVRRRIAEELDTTFFVEAAAGTGKTAALVERIVTLLRRGAASLERIAAVTFTEKAAGEMKLRLRERIEAVRALPGLAAAEAENLDAALEHLELAQIGTIHGFCADVLRLRPLEAGVDPLFEVVPEEESRRLLAQAFGGWLQQVLADPPEGVRRLLRRRPGAAGPGPREQLLAAAVSLAEHRDFDAPWRRGPFAREAAIDAVVVELAALGALAARAERADDYLAQNLAEVQRFVDELAQREAVTGCRDHDGLEAELRELSRARRVHWHWRGSPRRRFAADLSRSDVKARRDAAKAALDALVERCDADLAPRLREELRPVIERYQELEARAGVLDFVDLLVRARDLIVADAAVRADLQRRFSHFFVDEFQDTDPLQAEILLLLAADDPAETDWRRTRPLPGKLFLVGDPKQSIYRFRRADIAIYQETRLRLAGLGAEVVQLTTSFRAVPEIQAAINAAFEPEMQGGEHGSQADYVPLRGWRSAVEGRPSLVALPVPRPYGDYGTIVQFRIEESFPDAVGGFVAWLVEESGWTVTEPGRPDTLVAIAPRHVCLLFRRFKSWQTDVTRPYVRALEARRVPHVLVGGRSFHDREEVLALRNALCAIEWPDDELRVYASLRGPLFALGDAALLAFRHRTGSLHPLRPRSVEALEGAEREVAEALSVLAELHRGRNRRSLAETLTRLLRAVRAHAGIAIWPTGEQALANCLRVVDLARRFERQGAPSFRAFVERLEEQVERGEAAEAPVVEEGTEGVRIMTVHKAKGLEFPVVVLADPTANRVGRHPSRHVDAARRLWAEPLCGCAPLELQQAREEELRRDAEEGVRIAYVAATRARDLLVVPAVGDEKLEGWLDVFHPAVYPPYGAHREAEPAPGCPAFGADSVLERPARSARGPDSSVQPGLQRPRVGSHRVVWWDPAALRLDVEESVGLRQERILTADASGHAVDLGERRHAQWQAARRAALARGGQPLWRVAPVTALAAAAAAEETPAVELEESAGERAGRPGGRRFGSLVHAVLEVVPFDADAAAVAGVAALQGRLLGATAEEVAAAAGAVSAALAHPLLVRAARSLALRRETPLLLRLPDGVLAEGVVDLAFREADGWTVVDFKTDREIEAQRASYEAQVRLYARAVAAATGEPARGALLVV